MEFSWNDIFNHFSLTQVCWLWQRLCPPSDDSRDDSEQHYYTSHIMPDLQFENNDLQTIIKAIPTLAIEFLIFSPVKKAGNLW